MQPARIKPHAKEHTNNPVQQDGQGGGPIGGRPLELELESMELWSVLLIHHLHWRHESTFADPAGCSSYGARHATCTDKAPRERALAKSPSVPVRFFYLFTVYRVLSRV